MTDGHTDGDGDEDAPLQGLSTMPMITYADITATTTTGTMTPAVMMMLVAVMMAHLLSIGFQ